MRQLIRSPLHAQVQRKAANAAQEQRKALMGAGDYMQRAQQLKTQQDLTNSAADTTVSLQRTRQLMAEVYKTPWMPTSPANETVEGMYLISLPMPHQLHVCESLETLCTTLSVQHDFHLTSCTRKVKDLETKSGNDMVC